MRVVKRDGRYEPIAFDKICKRNQILCVTSDINDLTVSTAGNDKFEAINATLNPLLNIDPVRVSQKVMPGIRDEITTNEIDELSAITAQAMCVEHPEYGILASRILISNLQKTILYRLTRHEYKKPIVDNNEVASIEKNLFYYTVKCLWKNKDDRGFRAPLVSPWIYKFVSEHRDKLEEYINYAADYLYEVRGFRTMCAGYLPKALLYDHSREIIMCPQHMIMLNLIGILYGMPYEEASAIYPTFTRETSYEESDLLWDNSIELIEDTWAIDLVSSKVNDFWGMFESMYNARSQLFYMDPSPTMFHLGTLHPQGCSCFLCHVPDSLKGLERFWSTSSELSRGAGGIGSHWGNVRSKGSYIRGTGGISSGIRKFLKVSEAISIAVDQGGGRRPGSNATFLPIWHGDIIVFARMRRKLLTEEKRAVALFYSVMFNDEFLWRLRAGMQWYVMCPDECPGLTTAYNKKFSNEFVSDEEVFANPDDYAWSALYRRYVTEGKYRREYTAEYVYNEVSETISEEGIPYQGSHDACNRKHMQNNGIGCSGLNLCMEIQQGCNEDEVAVCVLKSICLSKFINSSVDTTTGVNVGLISDEYIIFEWEKLRDVVRLVVDNLNYLIDVNYYPVPEAKYSALRWRSIGIGVQGLADVMIRFRYKFGSPEALRLKSEICERMQYYAIERSCELAQRDGPYSMFEGSPWSKGIMPVDQWIKEGALNSCSEEDLHIRPVLDWQPLRDAVMRHGIRNVNLMAHMPTASSGDITCFSPGIEPLRGNIYVRSNKAGEFIVINKQMVSDLEELGMWNNKTSQQIIADDGSIAGLTPSQDVKELFETRVKPIYETAWEMSNKQIANMALVSAPWVCQSASTNFYHKNITQASIAQVFQYMLSRGAKTLSYYHHSRAGREAQKTQIEDAVCSLADGCESCQG